MGVLLDARDFGIVLSVLSQVQLQEYRAGAEATAEADDQMAAALRARTRSAKGGSKGNPGGPEAADADSGKVNLKRVHLEGLVKAALVRVTEQEKSMRDAKGKALTRCDNIMSQNPQSRDTIEAIKLLIQDKIAIPLDVSCSA